MICLFIIITYKIHNCICPTPKYDVSIEILYEILFFVLSCILVVIFAANYIYNTPIIVDNLNSNVVPVCADKVDSYSIHVNHLIYYYNNARITSILRSFRENTHAFFEMLYQIDLYFANPNYIDSVKKQTSLNLLGKLHMLGKTRDAVTMELLKHPAVSKSFLEWFSVHEDECYADMERRKHRVLPVFDSNLIGKSIFYTDDTELSTSSLVHVTLTGHFIIY